MAAVEEVVQAFVLRNGYVGDRGSVIFATLFFRAGGLFIEGKEEEKRCSVLLANLFYETRRADRFLFYMGGFMNQ